MVLLKHGVDTLDTERRYVLAKFRTRISPITSNHCCWPVTNTDRPNKIKVGANIEDKTIRIDTREGVRIVNNNDVEGTKKFLLNLRIIRILRDDG